MQETQSQTSPAKPPVVTLSAPQPTWRTRLSNWVFGVKVADNILKRRAVDLAAKLHVDCYLERGGVYVDIGAGTGHNSAHIARLAHGLDARFLCVEPVSKPTKRVLQRVDNRTDTRVQFIRAIGNRLPVPRRHRLTPRASFLCSTTSPTKFN